MTPKTEAQRRFEILRSAKPGAMGADADFYLALFSAIFDPLPPEPEPDPVKSLGERLWETAALPGTWRGLLPGAQGHYEYRAQAVVEAHEARRPKPTVDAVARAIRNEWPEALTGWETLDEGLREQWRMLARAVFPLFGVEP